MGEELVMSLVPCEPTGSRFSTPGFTPSSVPVLLPIPGFTESHFITLVQADLIIFSIRTSLMVSLRLTQSLSPPIALLRRGPSKSLCLEILFVPSEADVKCETICL